MERLRNIELLLLVASSSGSVSLLLFHLNSKTAHFFGWGLAVLGTLLAVYSLTLFLPEEVAQEITH